MKHCKIKRAFYIAFPSMQRRVDTSGRELSVVVVGLHNIDKKNRRVHSSANLNFHIV